MFDDILEGETSDTLERKMREVPGLRDVIDKLLGIEIGKNTRVSVTIVTQDFDRFVNNTYEKILK